MFEIFKYISTKGSVDVAVRSLDSSWYFVLIGQVLKCLMFVNAAQSRFESGDI